MTSTGGKATRPSERKLLEINEALLVSSVRQHELAEEAIKAGEAARRSEERYRILIETAPMALFVCDQQGVIETYNRLAADAWGREPVCGVERHCGSVRLWRPDGSVLPHEQSPIMDVLRTGVPAVGVELIIERPDGSRLPVLINFAPLKNESGATTGAISSFIDISDRKEIERELEERVQARTADLHDALRELEGFSYTVAHDLRAPLRAIIFASKFLLEDPPKELTDDQESLLVSQAVNAQKLARLIDDLLQFSRLGRLPVVRVPVDLTALARSAADEESQHGLGFVCQFEIQDGMNCRGDRGLLRLVLVNLIQNACKFSPAGGRVSVGISYEDVRRPYFVRDEGIGFDAAYAERIFQPFERLHSADEYPGTGIGLATVKRIIERHGGKVWADSVPSQGATVYFTLGQEETPVQE